MVSQRYLEMATIWLRWICTEQYTRLQLQLEGDMGLLEIEGVTHWSIPVDDLEV